ncbi:MAG: DUF4295 domain-containing protein [Flammeovirgaceae bacterium]|nr:DUF4295 domain-containing protein [Flammeovirgaceae bacterium]MDW8288583.1 DUF4295 domain-containing protein [Flammeovirgaceae bacterium]
MAKKVVATLKKDDGVKYAKVIRAIKSPKTGAYTFKEEIVREDEVKNVLAKKD